MSKKNLITIDTSWLPCIILVYNLLSAILISIFIVLSYRVKNILIGHTTKFVCNLFSKRNNSISRFQAILYPSPPSFLTHLLRGVFSVKFKILSWEIFFRLVLYLYKLRRIKHFIIKFKITLFLNFCIIIKHP